ncbi:hypothetical protein AGMMS49992_27870 [Clostridia bacterium]|nr:hypothetical protein AGMMS49992_27870 [Clostridia bacterium]
MGYISYEKAIGLLNQAGVNTYTIKKKKTLGQASYAAIMSGKSSSPNGRTRGTSLNTETISTLCEMLDCQPGDLLEYVKDDTKREGVVGEGEV